MDLKQLIWAERFWVLININKCHIMSIKVSFLFDLDKICFFRQNVINVHYTLGTGIKFLQFIPEQMCICIKSWFKLFFIKLYILYIIRFILLDHPLESFINSSLEIFTRPYQGNSKPTFIAFSITYSMHVVCDCFSQIIKA